MITLLPNHDLSRNNDTVIMMYVIIINFNPIGEIIIAYENITNINNLFIQFCLK